MNHYCPVINRITIVGYDYSSLKSCLNRVQTGFLRVFSQKASHPEPAGFHTYWPPVVDRFSGLQPVRKR